MRRHNDKLFADFEEPGVPGIAAVAISNGGTAFIKCCGLANLETRVCCAAETNFRLASLTKQFTAMAVLILAERGKLALEDKLPGFFPGFPPYGGDISVYHLLAHQSGLPDYEELIAAGTSAPLKDRDVLEILRRQNKPRFPAGAGFHYSNGGYALLALIVEAVSGRSFAEFLRENIFLPLEMTNTVALQAGVSEVPHRALGYSKRSDAFEETDQSLTSAVLGDGGIYSSVLDLIKWEQALHTEKLISRRLLEQALTAQSPSSDMPGSGYGFGWYVDRRGGHRRLWHYGATRGFSTRIDRWPDQERALILLANRSEAGLERIAENYIDSR